MKECASPAEIRPKEKTCAESMSVWLTIPSARPVAEANVALRKWRDQGYKIALWRDDQYVPKDEAYAIDCNVIPSELCCDIMIVSPWYPGYAVAVNKLIAHVMEKDTEAEWMVVGGDDTFPDPAKTADEIGRECSLYFGSDPDDPSDPEPYESTFGVMQPTGDRWQDTPSSRAMYGENRGALIDRVAGSAWIGREFARRINGGLGPYHPGFKHMFSDEFLQCIAEKYGVFWQRRDLTHYHAHAQRTEGVEIGMAKLQPPHLEKWNTRQHWDESKALFESLKAAGWLGSEPL